MRTLLIGIDSGTQSTKVLVVNAKNGKVIAAASQTYDLIPNLPPGAKEQHPHTWRDATARAIRQALKAAKAGAAEVKAIGVSGQQHGFVPLDQAGQVIRPAKLWCDTSTAAECEEITDRLGGLQGAIRVVGNAILPGYTAPKILWLKKREPKNYARLATVLLPHDYLNFWLTGEKVMEYGDASGTVLLEVRTGRWSDAAIGAIDPGLREKLPRLISSDRPAGSLQAATARALGLNSGTLVSAGGGDNMMGAIGTGNTRQGVITASFGTSGTIYACSEKPVIDPQGEIGAFCDSTNRWLPLLCTMNVTVATEMVRQDFDVTGICRFVLGPYWRVASPAEQQQFCDGFADRLVRFYGQRLAQSGSGDFVVTGSRITWTAAICRPWPRAARTPCWAASSRPPTWW